MASSSTITLDDRPKPAYRYLFWAGLFMLSGLCFLIYLGSDRRKVIGQSVLDLDLPALAHAETPFVLEKERGKLVLLHFWGPWCPPCRTEYPEILGLMEKYVDGKLVRIASISCAQAAPDDVTQLRQDTLSFMDGAGSDSPIYCDPVEYSRIRIARLLGQRGFSYPTTILLDADGNVFDYWVRPTKPGELDRAIRKALARSAKRRS
jgi:thiol-disulfide isomerase/thioredoxin